MAQRNRGTVKMFDWNRGFGFLAPESGGKDVWFSTNAIMRGTPRDLERGDVVEFEIIDGKKGKEAVRVQAFLTPERTAAIAAKRQAADAAWEAERRERDARLAARAAWNRVERPLQAIGIASFFQAVLDEVGGEFSPEWGSAWVSFQNETPSLNTVKAGWYTFVPLPKIADEIRAAAARGEQYVVALHPEDGEWDVLLAYWTPDPRPTGGLTPSDYDYDAASDTAAWVNPSECVEYISTPESRALQGIRDAMARARAATTLAETDAALCAALDAVYAAKGIAPQGVASSIIKARKSLRDAARTETRMTVGEPADVMARMDALLAHRARQAARGAAQTSETTVGASGATDNAAQPQENKMTEFVNLTPHAVTMKRADGVAFTVQPSGQEARRDTVRAERPALDGVPVAVVTFGDVNGLPEPREGVVYIVSGLVLAAVPHRADVVAPGAPIREAGFTPAEIDAVVQAIGAQSHELAKRVETALKGAQGRVMGAGEFSATPAYK